ncbi:MAG: hypothetical protein D6798_10055 [Deltaproteobacteria bacterium]|nr:MAG: hypothetical protein D6798_10055 [Deltaproteobacteria bacterium]
MADTDWQVLPHDDLVPLADNLWRVEGALPGQPLRRCMVVARSVDGDLALHSAIAMDEPHMEELESLGRPRWLVVPNGWHRLDAARYKARYPDLQVVCPAKARKQVERKVPVDGTYDDFSSLDGPGTIRLEHFDPARHFEGAMVVRSDDGLTLVFADSVFNLPHGTGFFWWFYGRVLGNSGGPRVTTISRVMMTITRSRSALRQYLARYADRDDVVRIVPGHGDVIADDAPAVLRRLADSL